MATQIALAAGATTLNPGKTKGLDRYEPGDISTKDLERVPRGFVVLDEDGVLRSMAPNLTVVDYVQLDPEQFHQAALNQLESFERLVSDGKIKHVPEKIQKLADLDVDGREVQDKDSLFLTGKAEPKRKGLSESDKKLVQWSRRRNAVRRLKQRSACNDGYICEPDTPGSLMSEDCDTFCDACEPYSTTGEAGICTQYYDSVKKYIGGVISPPRQTIGKVAQIESQHYVEKYTLYLYYIRHRLGHGDISIVFSQENTRVQIEQPLDSAVEKQKPES